MRALLLALALVLTGCTSTVDGSAAPQAGVIIARKPVVLRKVLQEVAPGTPGEGTRLPDRKGTAEYLLGPVAVTFDRLRKVEAKFSDHGAWVVLIELPPDAATRFLDVTTKNVNERLAIVVGDVVISAPTISGPIAGGKVEISGSFSQADAQDLAKAIGGG